MTMIVLKSAKGTIRLRDTDMAIVSAASSLSGQDFGVDAQDTPSFVLGYLDHKRRYRTVNSSHCGSLQVETLSQGDKRLVRGVFSGIHDMDIVLTLTALAAPDSDYIDFSVELDNRSGEQVIDIQYPFLLYAM